MYIPVLLEWLDIQELWKERRREMGGERERWVYKKRDGGKTGEGAGVEGEREKKRE